METEKIAANETQNLAPNMNNKPKKSKMKSFKRDALIFNFVCMLIPVLQWLVFWLYVNGQTILLAFKNPLTDQLDFTVNYEYIWRFHIDRIWEIESKYNASLLLGFRNTVIFFFLNICVTLPMSVTIAYFIYKKILGYKFFRIVFYLPAVLPAIILTTSFKEIVKDNGILDMLFHCIPHKGLLGNPSTALWTLIVYVILYSFTTNVLLFSGGMARVPMEVIEAAKLDGCNPLQEILFLIIPLIWPTLTTQIILALTNMFNGGGPVLLLSKGLNGTMTLSYWLFYQISGDGTSGASMGPEGAYRVSAVGLVLTAIAVPLILIVRKIFDRVEPVEY